ncbi:MAG: hypothetical protein Q4B75_09845 [Eubacteriales bacterium]|nr:hypothetical protein [Eubacteriales bacterium]
MKHPMTKREKIQIVFSLIIYSIIFVMLSLPWMVIGGERFSLLRLASSLSPSGAATFFTEHQIIADNPDTLFTGIRVSLILYLIYFLLCVIYLITVLLRKNWNINLAALLASIILAYTGYIDCMLGTICSNIVMATLFPFFLLLLSTTEAIGRKIIEHWDETVRDTKAYQEKEQLEKEERRQRLYFPGKYSRLFLKVTWKNFKNNWKDYLILFLCNACVFAFILTGFGFNKILGTKNISSRTDYFTGAGKILFDGVAALGIIGVFMLVLLLIYYLRKRIPQYGVFRTLGIRRKTLYLCIGAELGIGALLSILAGAVTGSLLIYALQLRTMADSGQLLPLSLWLSPLTLVKSLAVMLLIYLVTFFVTHDLFVGFRMGNLTDLQMMKEWMPKRLHQIPISLGVLLCIWMILRNTKTVNFEGMLQLLGCIVGIYLLLRFGLAFYFTGWQKKRNHLSKLLICHPFFHRSRTTSWYLFGLCVLQLCMLSTLSLQVFSTRLVTDPASLYPYDLVCLANTEDATDQEFFKKLETECNATVSQYPMFRVSGTDGTKKLEGPGQFSVMGQQIGISESTYHELKKHIDPSYQPVDLGLHDSDDSIYIVHQQDKSTKAQPIDYKTNRNTPYLYTGPVCEYVDAFSHITSFKKYHIACEEFTSLIGVFCEGERENLVVFSDSYFEKAKDAWKYTNMYTGEIISDYKTALSNELERTTEPGEINSDSPTRQGPSSLVLVTVNESELSKVEKELKDFRVRHKEDEVYDSMIESYYLKSESISALETQLQIKDLMGKLLMIAFFIASVLLIVIKMLTEYNLNKRRTDFLTCLGMRKKERIHLLRHEMNVYVVITALLSFTISTCLFIGSMNARGYNISDKNILLKWYLSFAGGELLAFALIIWLLTSIQIYLLEKH